MRSLTMADTRARVAALEPSSSDAAVSAVSSWRKVSASIRWVGDEEAVPAYFAILPRSYSAIFRAWVWPDRAGPVQAVRRTNPFSMYISTACLQTPLNSTLPTRHAAWPEIVRREIGSSAARASVFTPPPKPRSIVDRTSYRGEIEPIGPADIAVVKASGVDRRAEFDHVAERRPRRRHLGGRNGFA